MKGGFCFNMEIKPYRYGLLMSIAQSRKQLKRSLKSADKHFGTNRADELLKHWDESDGWLGFVVNMDSSDSFVYLRDMPDTINTRGVMVHELLHLTFAVLKARRIDTEGMGGEEAHCYLLEELCNEVERRVSRHYMRK